MQVCSTLTPAVRRHSSYVSAMLSIFLSYRLLMFQDSFRVQVRNTMQLSSTVHSFSTLTVRLQCPRLQSPCARATEVRTSLWAASSFVPTSTSHGRRQRLPLWVPVVLLPSCVARKPRPRKRLERMLRHSSLRRKKSIPRSLPIRMRLLHMATLTMLSSRATHVSVSAVVWHSLPQSVSHCRQRSMAACRCNS